MLQDSLSLLGRSGTVNGLCYSTTVNTHESQIITSITRGRIVTGSRFVAERPLQPVLGTMAKRPVQAPLVAEHLSLH